MTHVLSRRDKSRRFADLGTFPALPGRYASLGADLPIKKGRLSVGRVRSPVIKFHCLRQKPVDHFVLLRYTGLAFLSFSSQINSNANTAVRKPFARKRSLPNVNVAEVRSGLSMTQRAFAELLGVSCRTVEAWEASKSTPTPTAKKLMFLIQEDHTLVQKL